MGSGGAASGAQRSILTQDSTTPRVRIDNGQAVSGNVPDPVWGWRVRTKSISSKPALKEAPVGIATTKKTPSCSKPPASCYFSKSPMHQNAGACVLHWLHAHVFLPKISSKSASRDYRLPCCKASQGGSLLTLAWGFKDER
ncbi:hypothetical protein BS47DRAFT_1362258 [Hydnum rufescens UP504]|uniref:Uncharacterized protein n=1 Tax=Hydnum rufescens UP504 TaxID=1448309 RepID=A0A9P6AXA5_9AGAM|nr:hypothetical protein BS47DRAFT_1362258 [Hydnum rufescens UP504]